MKTKVLIIGGGVAGLSAGIYSRLNGFETEIVEMHKLTGGQCTAWDRKGYRFDYCLHWLVGTSKGPFSKLWQETNVLNQDTQVLDHDIHSVLVDEEGNELIIYANIDRWEKYLLEMAPEDAKSIKKMCRHMRRGAAYEPLDKVQNLHDLGIYLGSIIRMTPFLSLFLKYGKKSSQDYFNMLNFKNPKLKFFFSNLVGGNDFSALAIIMMLSWFHQKNAGYIIGGSLPLAKRMEDRYTSLGGKLNLGKVVEKILEEDNKATGVQLSDGTIIKADYVISAADGHSTIFNMLEGRHVSEQHQKAYDTWPLFNPLVQVSFGINSELNGNDAARSVMAKGKTIGSTKLASGYSLMNYSFDPTMAPEGKTVMVMRFESPWDNWKDIADADYKEEKKKIADDATALLEKHFPGVSKNIEVVDVATPRTTVKYTGVWKGAYEGFLPSSGNITKRLKNTLPGLERFYMAGQWLFPGGGIPPSVLSGKTAVKAICREEKRGFRVKL